MEQATYRAAPEPGARPGPLVVIVADTAEQRLDLAAGVPIETPILLTADLTQARRLLAQLPGASGRPLRGPEPPAPIGRQSPGGRSQRRPLRLCEDRVSLIVGDREAQLTRLEFALLQHLLPRVGEVVTYEQLSQVGWNVPYLGDGAHMHAAIGRLRVKLADLGAPLALQAVRGLGFRLVQHTPATAAQEAVGS